MKIALIQFDTVWECIDRNLETLTHEIDLLESDVDMAVLPEMFSTGFTMQPEYVAEPEFGKSAQWMISMAQKYQIAIAGSLVVSENDRFYNRLFFVFPDGSYKTYNKKHLFTLAGEDKIYTPGKDKLIVEYKGWKICPLICYDLRFPVFSRIQNLDYDLLLYVASWPDKRIYAWDQLLKARAIENMSYVIGVNRCGIDPNGVVYSGHSQAIDYMGENLLEPMKNQQTQIITLDWDSMQKARKKLAFLDDADDFLLQRND